ncbi:MAG: SDR family NAD(P)-dependent oxidoreductase [Pseudomonadota bacterium]
MTFPLAGRHALITGVTSGIGAATAKRIVELGGRVIGAGRREDRLAALSDQYDGKVTTATLDMQDTGAIASFAGGLDTVPDILINNAGLALGLAGADAADLDHWDQMIDTNVRGLVHLTRHLLPKMKELERADVINISSVAGSYPYPGGNAYGGTKAFVTQFSLNLRPDLLGSNVRVTSVEPGMTETEFSNVRFEGDDAKADQVYNGMKPLAGADVARVITDILALPAHININRVEIMPVQQAFGPFAVARDG